MNPCGSGQRLWRMGRYGEDGWGVTDEAHDWSYGREGFPLYCTHCAFMNETLPIRWIGYPVYPSDPPDDFDRDPCTWYWYKDPADIPDRHFDRYGLGAADGGLRSRTRPSSVREALADALGERPRARSSSRRIPGGASRETLLVEARRQRWVLRRDPPGAESFVPLAVEFARRSALAAAAGVPVPEPLRFEPEGGRFGTAGIPDGARRREPRWRRGSCAATSYAAARGRLAAQLGEALARIHSIDARGPGGRRRVRRRSGARPAASSGRAELDRIGEPLPGGRGRACAGCGSTCPPPAERPALVHGDFRLGNFIVDERRPGGGDRLGALPRRRPGRGHRLALHPLVAVRQRRPAGGRARCARGVPRRLRGRRRAAARSPSGCAGGRRWATSSGR